MSEKLFAAWIPFPPSVNSAYGGGSGQKRFKSAKYKEWERRASLMLRGTRTIYEPVRLEYFFYMPDKRPRDVGNYEKLATDLIVKRGILPDDNVHHIKEIRLVFAGYDHQNPRVEVDIYAAAN